MDKALRHAKDFWTKIQKEWSCLTTAQRKAVVDYHHGNKNSCVKLAHSIREQAKKLHKRFVLVKSKWSLNMSLHLLHQLEVIIELLKPEYSNGFKRVFYASEGRNSLQFSFIPFGTEQGRKHHNGDSESKKT